MAQKATIFIPDISGYTRFLTTTELTHASHIINELLEIIVRENNELFDIGEIEGDAVLMYKAGDPPRISELNEHCLKIFRAFHRYLKVIERDRLCNCGACIGAAKLNLKFIAHYGDITTISVGGFTKASGLDLIVAHRLLKNSIDGDGYIMYSQSLLDVAEKDEGWDKDLEWTATSDSYEAIGEIKYSYSPLETVKQAIPEPESNSPEDLNLLEDAVELDIDCDLDQVYHQLLDPRTKQHWVAGMKEIQTDAEIDRVNTSHICVLEGLSAEITMVGGQSSDEEITLIDRARIVGADMEMHNFYKLHSLGPKKTHVLCQIGPAPGFELPDEMASQLIQGRHADMARFKEFCEQSC